MVVSSKPSILILDSGFCRRAGEFSALSRNTKANVYMFFCKKDDRPWSKNVTVKHDLSYREKSRWRRSLSLNARPSFAFSATTTPIEAARLGMGVGSWGSVLNQSSLARSGV